MLNINKLNTMQQNTLTVTNSKNKQITVTAKQLPFSNNFVQNTAKLCANEAGKFVAATVTCTANSREPGRIYAVYYTMLGNLISCCTLN